jgi:DNA-binding PucR family transcriptional regulator
MQTAQMTWPIPSPRVQELLRRGAELALSVPTEWQDELDQATLSGPIWRTLADDPVLAAATRRTNRSNLLFWAAANVRAPGEPVPANLSEAPLAVARDLVRRGVDESGLDAYRVGQNVAWRFWMRLAFSLTDDPAELQELLDVSSRSISAFIDATVDGIAERMRDERARLTAGANAERREVVTLVLEGAPITAGRAEARLGYPLGGTHHAAIVWSAEAEPDVAALDRVAVSAVRAAAGPTLRVTLDAGTRWLWSAAAPDPVAVAAALQSAPGVQLASTGPGDGMDGFRRVHLDAVTTQRLLARSAVRRMATYEDIALVSLALEVPDRAARFVSSTLGALEHAPADLREVVRTYIRCGSNATAAAAASFTHRNTILRRLDRAERLLPRPLADHPVEVAVALELIEWRGR